jgi:hypothetical protein
LLRAACRVSDPLNLRRQPQFCIEMPGEGDHQLCAVSKVEIDRLPRHTGGPPNLRHRDMRIASFRDERERCVQNAPGRART